MGTGAKTSKGDEKVVRAKSLLAKARQEFGDDHITTLGEMHRLADAYRDVGEDLQAANILEEELEGRIALQGREHRHSLLAMADLGWHYFRLDELQKLMSIQEAALTIGRKVFDADHRFIAVILGDLANTAMAIGDYEYASQLRKEQIDHFEHIKGNNDSETLEAIEAYVDLRRILGDYETALDFDRLLVARYTEVSCEQARTTLLARVRVTTDLLHLGRISEASELANLNLETALRTLSPVDELRQTIQDYSFRLRSIQEMFGDELNEERLRKLLNPESE